LLSIEFKVNPGILHFYVDGHTILGKDVLVMFLSDNGKALPFSKKKK